MGKPQLNDLEFNIIDGPSVMSLLALLVKTSDSEEYVLFTLEDKQSKARFPLKLTKVIILNRQDGSGDGLWCHYAIGTFTKQEIPVEMTFYYCHRDQKGGENAKTGNVTLTFLSHKYGDHGKYREHSSFWKRIIRHQKDS